MGRNLLGKKKTIRKKMLDKLIITCAIAAQLLACNKDEKIREKFKTQSKFRCQVVIEQNKYKHDSILLVSKISSVIKNKESPYDAPVFAKNTIVSIDTILYDSQKQHCAIFVVLKCFEPITKVWVYDGLVHFAESNSSQRDSLDWDLYSYHGALHINSETYEKMSYVLRFHNLAGRSYTGYLRNKQNFNLDDCRFWDSRHFKDTIQKEGFYIFSQRNL